MEDYLVANYDINFRTLWEAPNHSKLLAPPSLSFFVSLSLSLNLPLSLFLPMIPIFGVLAQPALVKYST